MYVCVNISPTEIKRNSSSRRHANIGEMANAKRIRLDFVISLSGMILLAYGLFKDLDNIGKGTGVCLMKWIAADFVPGIYSHTLH